MPMSIKKMGSKWRLVGPDGKIEKRDNGGPVDGGGHSSKDAAIKQMQAININKHKAELEEFSDIERAAILGISLDYFYSLTGIDSDDPEYDDLLKYSFALKINETPNQFRVLVKDPSKFDIKSFKIEQIKVGLSVISGRPKNSAKSEIQSFRFDKAKFTKKDVLKFIKDNTNKF